MGIQQPPPPPSQFQFNPQQPMPPQVPKKKRSKLPIILGIIAGVILLSCVGIIAFVGTAIKSSTTGTITSSSGSNTNNSSSNSSPTNQIAKVGQTITVSDVGTTLVSVKTLAADEYNKPKPGNEFIVVHIKMVNSSSSEQSYNPLDFHVKSGSGNITDEEIITPLTYKANNQLHYGKLSAGGSVEGDIIFQVPNHDHKAELTWKPSIFGTSTDNAWNLGL